MLLAALVGLVLLLWLSVRAVKAWHGGLVLWVVIACLGVPWALAVERVNHLLGVLTGWSWALWVIGGPVWWVVRRVTR